MRARLLGVLAGVLLGAPFAAHAGLAGQTFNAAYYYPDASTPYVFASFSPASFMVGAGQETTGDVEGITWLDVDFDDDSLTLAFRTILSNPTWNVASFNGVIFAAALAHGITGATVDGSSTMVGFDASRLVIDGDSIGLNWAGLSYVDGTVLKIDFEVTPVPGPAALGLLGIGLVGLGLTRRRQRA